MACKRAETIDVDAFLLGVESPEREAFRNHYPECPGCAAAVGDWMALEMALREELASDLDGFDAHPSPERLDAYAADSGVPAASKEEIDMHLEACSTCRAELALLTRFDPGVLQDVAREPTLSSETAEGWLSRIQRFVFGDAESLGAPVWAPAALAALIVTALFFGWQNASGPDPQGGSKTPAIADSDAAEPGDKEPDLSRLAESSTSVLPTPSAPPIAPSPRAPGATPAGDLADAPSGEASEPKLAKDEPGESQPRTSVDVEPSLPEVVDSAPLQLAEADITAEAVDLAPVVPSNEILLAALSELPLPSYAAPDAVPGSMSWMRQFGPTRLGSNERVVEVRAPQSHVGLTARPSPRLWWSIKEQIDEPLQVTIVGDGSVRPVLRLELPGPHAPGLHAFDLADHDVSLDADRGYRWFVSVLVDPKRPSRNPVSAGALRRVETSDVNRSALNAEAPAARGHALAKLGIWYDAFDFFASLAVQNPERNVVASHLKALRADPSPSESP